MSDAAAACDLAVVVVSYETRERTLACLASVLEVAAGDAVAASVVLVDNASQDGTARAARERFGERVEVVANGRNAGFGAACNQGAARVPGARHVLFLNADTTVLPGALAGLVAALDGDAGAGAAGPAVVGDDGAPQPSVRGHPTPLALLHQHTALRFVRLGARAYERYKAPDAREDDVPVVLGAALAVRRTDLDALGGFDERYFLYFEEADLCRRLAARGRRVRFVPGATVRHRGGASSDPRRGPALAWYLESLFRYVDRFHGIELGVLYRIAFKPLFLLRMATDALRDALTWLVRPAKRPAKSAELRLAAWFLGRGLVRFLRA